MKRFIASLMLTFLIAMSAGISLLPTAQAQSEVIIFSTQIRATNEVPPVTVNPTEATAAGNAVVTLNVTRSGGAITAASAQFDVTVGGLASNVILAHIHEGGATVNGPVRVDSGLSPASPVPPVSGTATFSRGNLAVTNAIAQSIINNPDGFYFNVHTALSPGGVARGQLVRQQSTPGGVTSAPTLSEWGAILMTLLIIAACTFFLVGRARSALAGGATAGALAVGGAPAINWRRFVKLTLYLETAAALVLLVLGAGAVDVMGALTSTVVVAFILHLLLESARKR